MEEQKRSIGDVAAVAVLPMQTSESNKISIIIPESAATSKVMPFEQIHGGSVSSWPHADAAQSSVHQGLRKVNAVPLIKKHDGVESLLGIATSAGLAITVLVLSLIHISGCHLNPAVSMAMAVVGHLPLAHILPYVAAQILGSIAASFIVKGIYHPVNPGIITIPKVGSTEAFFLEFITTFVLLFVVTALATNAHAMKELIEVAVGATIMMNALVAGPSTGASVNRARTLGPAIAIGTYTQIWIYMVATPLGAIAGTGAYVAIKL